MGRFSPAPASDDGDDLIARIFVLLTEVADEVQGIKKRVAGFNLLTNRVPTVVDPNLKPLDIGRASLSAFELSKRLGISERHVWEMHRKHLLGPPPISLGRAKRWVIREVDAWLAAGSPQRDEWLERRKALGFDA